MIKKFFIFAVIWVSILVVIYSVNPVKLQNSQSTNLYLVLDSPKKTYKVVISGKGEPKKTYELKNSEHEVKASVSKLGKSILEDFSIYSGDAYDDGFIHLYPDNIWLTDSMLSFGKKANFDHSVQSEVRIFNKTKKYISNLYVKVGKFYIFLLFDIEPNSTNSMSVHIENWERIVGCKGKFVDGNNINYSDVEFSSKDKRTTPAHYCVILKDDKVIIGSQEFEGTKLDGTSVPVGVCSSELY